MDLVDLALWALVAVGLVVGFGLFWAETNLGVAVGMFLLVAVAVGGVVLLASSAAP